MLGYPVTGSLLCILKQQMLPLIFFLPTKIVHGPSRGLTALRVTGGCFCHDSTIQYVCKYMNNFSKPIELNSIITRKLPNEITGKLKIQIQESYLLHQIPEKVIPYSVNLNIAWN
jgi:hypothetical protein